MEELLEVTRKQLRFQKIITGCLVLIIVMLLAAGRVMADKVNQMNTVMQEAMEKIDSIDVDGINDAIDSTNRMLESADEFAQAVDSVTGKVQEFNSWFSGIFGN